MPKAKGLTPKQISEMLSAYEGISKIMEAVREHAIKLAHSGVDIPGYEASFTAARRVWADEKKADKLLGKLGLLERHTPPQLLSPAQAEKALRAAGKWPKRPKGSAADDFADPLKPVLSYTDTKPSISRVAVK
jgi:hypothetical protein